VVVAVVSPDRAVGGDAVRLGLDKAVLSVPEVPHLAVPTHVAVGVIGGESLDRIDRIYRIGDQGVLVEAVGRVGVGQGVHRRPDAVADGVVEVRGDAERLRSVVIFLPHSSSPLLLHRSSLYMCSHSSH